MNWQEITAELFDIIVIGAGINGAGIALDASQRGLKVLVVEKHDYGSGTTSASTRLIHGGLRYLEYLEFGLVRESLQEREILLHIAGDMVRPIPILLPIYKSGRRGFLTISLGMALYDLLSLNKSVPGHRMLSRAATLQHEPALQPQGLRGSALYFDSQIEFPERLCWTLVHQAQRAGAIAINYCQAIAFEMENDVQMITLRDLRDSRQHQVRGRVVINAAGPWVDEVRQLRNPRAEKLIGGTKGSHLVVRKKPGGPQNAIYTESPDDGRPFFIIPWLDYYLIGTTDLIYDGNLNEVVITRDEVDYLLHGVNAILQGYTVGYDDILYTYSGVRPLPATRHRKAAAITRRYHIYVDKTRPGCAASIDIVGGKLTTYRRLAEQTVDKIARILKRTTSASGTKNFHLLESPEANGKAHRSAGSDLDPATRKHLLRLYGDDAHKLVAMVSQQPRLGKRICKNRPDIFAQAVYAVTVEHALTLEDIFFRRTSIGWSETMGLDCCEKVAALVAPYLNWDENKQAGEVNKFRQKILHKHMPGFLPVAKKWEDKFSYAN